MKKLITFIMALLLLAAPVFGTASNRRYYHIDILDEWGELITSATQIDVQNESEVAVAVYTTLTGSTEVGSTGVITTGISDGSIEFWYADTALDLTVTDGTYTREIESFGVRDHRFMFPTFLTAMASLTVGSSQILDFTTGGFVLSADTSNELDIVPDNDTATIFFGDSSNQMDIYFYSTGATAYMFFDEGSKILEMVDVDIDIDDDAVLTFGDGDDFEIYSDTDGILELDPATQGNSIYFGTVEDDSVDMKWWTTTAGNYVFWDEGADEVYHTDVDLQIDDDCFVIFGDGDDWTISSTVATILQLTPAGSAELDQVIIGATTAGADLKVWGDTGTDYWMWDATEDQVIIIGDEVTWTLTEAATTAVNIDITGTNGGFDLDTTDGPVALTAAGVAYGDVTITVGDDYTNTVNDDFLNSVGGDLTHTVTGTYFADVTAQAKITSSSNAASSVLLTSDGGTSGQIRIFNDSGSMTDSIYLLSDVGGITMTTSAGSMTFTATGSSLGDVTWSVADDWTNTVAGDWTLAVTGSTTLDDILYKNTIIQTASLHTILVAGQSGAVISTETTGGGSQVYVLPTAVAGLTFTFIDHSIGAADDMTITAASGDYISTNAGATANSLINVADECNAWVRIVAIDADYWMMVGASGTWSD